jgi:hypothetical protein
LSLDNCYANYGSTNARELASMLEADLAGNDAGATGGSGTAG